MLFEIKEIVSVKVENNVLRQFSYKIQDMESKKYSCLTFVFVGSLADPCRGSLEALIKAAGFDPEDEDLNLEKLVGSKVRAVDLKPGSEKIPVFWYRFEGVS